MLIPPKAPRPPEKEPLITPEADKALLRILLLFGGATAVLFLVTPFIGVYANVPGSPLFGIRRSIDLIETFIMLTPFFFGIAAMSKARMSYARKYAEEGNWKAVYGATESFSQLGQRFLDGTGEAHYLLSLSLDNFGEKVRAEKARQFVIKYRSSSVWAEKLRTIEAARTPKRISEIRAKREDTGRKLTKSRRRF